MKFVVFLERSGPEIINADQFGVDQGVLSLYRESNLVAAFRDWVGIKQDERPDWIVTTESTTSNPARAKLRAHFKGTSRPVQTIGRDQR